MRKMLFIVPEKLADIEEHMLCELNGPKIIPYGVLSCIAYAKANSEIDVEFKVLDLNVENATYSDPKNIIIKCLREFGPDVVGISVLFNNLLNQLYVISSIVKTFLPECIVIAGGNCAVNEYHSIFATTDSIDCICYSEGEIPLTRLLSAENMHMQLHEIPSFVTKRSLRKCIMPISLLVEDLNQIPFIDYKYVKLNKYEPYPSRTTNFSNDDVAISMHSTRGCPFNCIFCCASKIHGKIMRYTTAKYFLENVDYMIDNYGLTILTIEDDNFLVDKTRAKEILKGLLLFKQQKKLKSVSILTVAVTYIDERIVALFKALDINNINVASEHGSEYMLRKIIDKPCSLNMIRNVVSLFKKYNLFHILSIVVGIPGEREIDRLEAIQFYLELGVEWVSINIATPYKGSRLYTLCMDNGYIDPADLKFANLRRSIINTPEISASEITEKAYLMNLELNFVNNYRLRIGDYPQAISRFEDISCRHDDHAFAHYYLAKAYRGVGNEPKYFENMDHFNDMINRLPKWREYAMHFGLI